jgi:arylsulfatase A-like enzyme
MVPDQLTYARRLTDAGLQAIRELSATGAPWFLFLHFMDPHSDTSMGGNCLPYYVSPEDLTDHQRAASLDAARSLGAACATELLIEADASGAPVQPEVAISLRQLYELGTRDLDRELNRLWAGMQSEGHWDTTLVVVTADHGEEFREHGRFLHSQPYEETSRVPLIVRPPAGGPGRTVTEPVSLVDVVPTVLSALGLGPAAHTEGIDVFSEPVPADRAVVLQDKLVRSRFGLVRRNYKLIMDLKTGERELYDLRGDPLETINLALDPAHSGASRAIGIELVSSIRRSRQLKHALSQPGAPTEGEPFGDEAKERLRSLGYL